jgi:hypothetical protein
MSAFGTEKFPTTSLRLGFPTAYQNAYSELGATPRFAPDPALPAVNVTVGHDLQADWHEQKKTDADRMVRAKVQSTHNMYNRANSAPNNSPGHQQPVLGQRKFANPAYGALQSGNPAREDYSDAPFHFSDANRVSGGCDYDGGSNGRLVGGVLRSAQGQSYGQQLLQRRIGDFERIAQEQEQFAGLPAVPRESQGVSEFAGEQPQADQQLGSLQSVELSQLLQNVVDSISRGETDDKGVNRLTVSDSTRAFSLIVRMATTAGTDDLADVLEYLDGTSAEDGIIPKLRALMDNQADGSRHNQEIFISLLEFWERVKVYLTKMMPTVGMPFKNRQNASQAFIKSLGFTKLFKGRLPEEFIEAQDAQDAVDARRGARFPGGAPGAPRGDGGDDDDAPPPPGGGGGARLLRREDTQHGYRGVGSARFSADDRQRFGFASGEWRTGGRAVGWVGEEGLEYGEAPLSPEQAEGTEEYVEDATSTNPGNAGARLVSFRSPVTGEWDVQRGTPPTSARSARDRLQLPGLADLADQMRRESRAETQRGDAELVARQRAQLGAPSGLPPFLRTRSDLPSTISGLQALARRVNEHYNGSLPDGKAGISVGSLSKVRNVKQNFIRRLNLPS